MLNTILGTHHAILVEGDPKEVVLLFHDTLEKVGVVVKNNPDVITLQFENLGIDEARTLVSVALGAPFAENKKRIVLSFLNSTIQAQNALLKLFEDPNPSVEFLIATENASGFLPTLRSRLHIIRREGDKERSLAGKKFLDLSIKEKLESIEKMLKTQKDSCSKQEIKDFLRSILTELEKSPEKNAVAIRTTSQSLLYINDTSSSVKMLLESVALVS